MIITLTINTKNTNTDQAAIRGVIRSALEEITLVDRQATLEFETTWNDKVRLEVTP